MGFFDKLFGKKEKESLDQGLQKTKEGFLSKITKAVAGKSTVDEEVLEHRIAFVGGEDLRDVRPDAAIEALQRGRGIGARRTVTELDGPAVFDRLFEQAVQLGVVAAAGNERQQCE